MKKIISFLSAAVMAVNVCAFAAADTLTGTYTFIDTAYSPDLDMYVAMAKDFSAADHKTQLYRSKDGVEWTACFRDAKPGKNYAAQKTRQNLVWWEDEGVFAAQVGGTTYVSSNGVNWTVPAGIGSSSNGLLETDGESLMIVHGRTMKIIPTKDSTAESFALSDNSGRYYYAAGKYKGEEKYFALQSDQYGGYMGKVEGAERTVTKDKFIGKTIDAVITDMSYISQSKNWIATLTNKKAYAVIGSDIMENVSSVKKIEPKNVGENITGTGVGENYAVLGTETGKLFYTDIADVESNSGWKEIAVPEGVQAPDKEIRSISKSRDGFMIAVSENGTYILQETDDGVIFADTTKVSVDAKTKRIEAPQTGSQDVSVQFAGENYFGQEITGMVKDVTTEEEGISAAWDGSKMTISVPDTAEGEKIFTVTDTYDKTHDVTINFVKENDVDLEGFTTIALPDEEGEVAEADYKAYVLASDGEKMNRKAEISVVSAPAGIEFNAKNNKVTATSASEAGTLILRVTSVGKPENNKDFNIEIKKRTPDSIEVTTDKQELQIPEKGTETINAKAVVKDQNGTPMNKEKVSWSLDGDTKDITIDDEGKITIGAEANSGKLTVIATSLTDTAVSGEMEITLTWSDERAVNEAVAAFDTETVTGENLDFSKTNKDGVSMKFETSDEKVITSEGVITRNRRKDTKATVKINAQKGEFKAEKTITVTVLKEDNIAGVGDFEDPTQKIENGTITDKDAHSGKYAAKMNGAFSADVKLDNESVYVFEAYVKSDSGATLSIEKGDERANVNPGRKYARLCLSKVYTKNDDEFTEKVTVNGADGYLLDDFKVYEITDEYNEVMEKITKAEYSRDKDDIADAKKAVEEFLDIPLKDELKKRVDAIKPKSNGGSNTGGNTGGGSSGGSGGGSFIPPSSKPSSPSTVGGETVDNDEKVNDYLLVFKDMKGHWAKDDVEFMANKGFVNGVSEGNFNPDANITRAEFATLVVKTIGLSAAEYENTYYDVVSDDWFAGYVQAAKNEGYVSGYNGMFRPNDYITREEIAKVIVAAYNQKTNNIMEPGGALYFTDIESISAWAYDYIVEATKQGFVNGVSEMRFAPKNNATRAQAAVMLKRLYDKLNG